MVSALDGIRVLDLTHGPAGALASMFLSDNGARVIHALPPGGHALRADPGYKVWDRGKESIFLDVSADRLAFQKLVGASDVLLESYAPSSDYQAFVSYERLAPLNPGIVHCSITAYGREGPLRDEPAQHDLVMARVGILASQPSFRAGPVHVVHPLPHVGAALLAAQGMVAALLSREKTGRGRKVETSLMAGALIYAPKVGGDAYIPRLHTGTPSGGAPFYSLMECADGEWIHLGCIHVGFIERAAAAMGIAHTVAEPKYGYGRSPESEEMRRELFDIVANVIKTKSYAEWAETFENADVPYARASTAEDGMGNPQVSHNGMVIEIDDGEVGRVTQMGLPIGLSRTPGRVRGASPVPGADTARVLSELEGAPEPEPVALDDSPLAPPLKGIRVLELTNVLAGPTAGKMLADLGAETIKMESPAGDISRSSTLSSFHYLNANKRSISVNAATPEGREAAQRLAARADVLLANMRPGATGRLGLGSDELKAINPGLVETHITAFGWDGPYAHRAGVDPLAQALTGLERAQGGPELQPVYLGALAPTDFIGGALGALAALVALLARERHGVAQKADTNLLNGGIVMSVDGFMRYDGKPVRRLPQKHQFGLGALHRMYQAKDGWLYLIAESQPNWESLCAALGHDWLRSDGRFASEAMRLENDAALSEELSLVFRDGSLEYWLRRLKEASVLCAPVVEEYNVGFFSDAQAIANDMIVEHRHPTLGLLKLMCNGVSFPGSAAIDALPTPLLGEHARGILREAGYSEAEIDGLYEKDVAKTEEPAAE